MIAALPTPILPRVASLLRLLGSDQDGEALGAARALQRTLAGAGSDLHTLADVVERGPETVFVERPAPAPRRAHTNRKMDAGHIDWPSTRRREVRETLDQGLHRLSFTEWERNFITNVIGRLRDPRGRLTFRQAEVAERLVAKIEASR